jgi:hypothetical protein
MHLRSSECLVKTNRWLTIVYLLFNFRKVQVVQWVDGDEVVDLQTVYVLLKPGEYNVDSAATKVSEALNTSRSYIILDNSSKEISSCENANGWYAKFYR